MDYVEIFRPILSLAAHAIPDRSELAGAAWNPGAFIRDLKALLAQALTGRRPSNAAYFDMAWLAASVWVRAKAGRVLLPPPPPLDAATMDGFFLRNLNALLRAAKQGDKDAENTRVLEVYALCLETGGGNLARFENLDCDALLRRCRRALSRTGRDGDPLSIPPPPCPAEAGGRRPAGFAALWIAPPLAVGGLYWAYRLALAALLETLTG